MRSPTASRLRRCIDAFERGDIDALLAVVDEADLAQPDAAEVAAAGDRAEEIADALCRAGLLLVEHGRASSAAELYNSALTYCPDHTGALLLLGRIRAAAGEFDAAEACVRRLIALEPNDADVHRELANLLLQAGRIGEIERVAEDPLNLTRFDGTDVATRLAIEERRSDALAERQRGRDLLALNRFVEAEAAFVRATKLDPDFAEAWGELANIQVKRGRLVEAEMSVRRALAVEPENPDAYNQLGLILMERQLYGEAEAQFMTSIACRPDYPASHVFLGHLRSSRRKFDAAESSFRRALALDPENTFAYGRLAVLLARSGRPPEAVQLLETVLARHSSADRIALLLGELRAEEGRLIDAETLARSVLARSPRSAGAHALLGKVQNLSGNAEQAAGHYISALEIDAAHMPAGLGIARQHASRVAAAGSYLAHADPVQVEQIYGRLLVDIISANESDNLQQIAKDGAALLPGNKLMRTACAYARVYDGDDNDAAIGHDFRAVWGPLPAPFGKPFVKRARTAPLRIGYVGQYLHAPLMSGYFRHHDFDACEIFMYSDDDPEKLDSMLPRLHWQSTRNIDLAESFRNNRIDLCIDLLTPMPIQQYMPVAEQVHRRLAPVQCSWINTFTSVGGSAHDYVIADPEVIPPEHEADFVERVVRLPDTHWSFATPKFDIEPGPLPALRNGYITFGTANRALKITDATRDMWARVLAMVPDSRLRFFGSASLSLSYRQGTRAFFHDRGIDPDRIEFTGPGSQREALEFYRGIDLSLDTYPYSGGITGFEALWMGVPLVTRTGGLYVSRFGRSMLTCIGRGRWVTRSPDEFVACAVALTRDLATLASERATLRQLLVQSPLCQGEAFARSLEAVFRHMVFHPN